jgi:hypothetical protein
MRDLEAMPGVRKPFLIRMLVALLGLVATAAGVMVLVTLFSRGGTYYLNGDVVTRAEFLARAVPWLLLVGVMAGMLGWAFWTDRRWARHAFVVVCAAWTIAADLFAWNDPAIDADEVFVTVFSMSCLLPVLWYFYLKRNVIEYYRALARRRATYAS